MNKIRNIETIIKNKIIAIIRVNISADIERIVESLITTGINVLEISINTPDALKAIEGVSRKYKDEILIGAGTVIDEETAARAISAGAEFIVSPICKHAIIKTCSRYGVISIPGFFTPTEALTAYEEGADFLKLFPAGNLGPSYIKAIKAPLPHLPIIPVGGVNLNNAREFLDSGASALAIGSALISKEAIKNRDYKSIELNTKKFIECISER